MTATAYAEPTIAGPVRETHRPHFAVPPDACDCHAHVFGPQTRFPYDPARRYTPHDCSLADYTTMLRALGFGRGVLVQPSVYMTDNAAMLDVLASAEFPLRAIAVVPENISDAELERMHKLGVRGLRLNLRTANGMQADSAPALARRIAELGWHLQLRITEKNQDEAMRLLDAVPVDVVVDHIGQVPVEPGTAGPAFQGLLRLLATGRIWVKLSAPMRMSRQEYPYADVTPFVQALVAAAPDRMLWATDWPHTNITTCMPDDGALCDLLLDWIPDAATRQRVLVDNPAARYGF